MGQATPSDRLAQAVEQVSQATASRFGARDTTGTPLEGLKVIQSGGRYVGVYHAQAGQGFETYVGTSTDLLQWTKGARLDTDASQPTISALSDGGYLVAYEWANFFDVVPRLGLAPLRLSPPLSQVDPLNRTVVTADRIRIRFRYYPSLERLLSGHHSREFTAPRQLSSTAQGTPSITSAVLAGGLSRSRIEVGLHYRADTDGNGYPDDDRQGSATLTDFRSWSSRVESSLNGALATTTDLHAPYETAPTGNYGDRDDVVLDGAALQVIEAQYRRGDFGSWRLFLRDRASGSLRALRVATPGGSSALGNPTVTHLLSPNGRPAVLVTAFVFGEGSAAGEPGPLVYFREL